MNILHIISQHPESTGSGFYLQNLLRQAEIAGHRNFLVAGISSEPTLRMAGVDPESCRFVKFSGGDLGFAIPGMSDVMPYASSRFNDLTPAELDCYEQAFAEKICQAARDFAIDLVHSHHLWIVSAVTRRVLAGYPMVTSCHSTDLRQLNQCPHLLDRVVAQCRRIDRILALSASQAETICHLYNLSREKIDIVGTGFDDQLFTMGRDRETTPIHLLYAGKLSYAKGVDWLLRVFAEFEGRSLHLHLAGSGHGDEAAKCLATAAKMRRHVTVHGAISQKKLAELMRRCHIFVLPSFYEGLPLVLLEALASGCRIVTTNLPGCLELLENVTPELVEFIALPRMQSIDRPDSRDWHFLDRQLVKCISTMVDRVMQSPSPPYEAIKAVIDRSNWQALFRKIAGSYDQARSDHLVKLRK